MYNKALLNSLDYEPETYTLEIRDADRILLDGVPYLTWTLFRQLAGISGKTLTKGLQLLKIKCIRIGHKPFIPLHELENPYVKQYCR